MIAASAAKASERVSTAYVVCFWEVLRTLRMMTATSFVVVGASGGLSWGGTAEVAWPGLNIPPSIVWVSTFIAPVRMFLAP